MISKCSLHSVSCNGLQLSIPTSFLQIESMLLEIRYIITANHIRHFIFNLVTQGSIRNYGHSHVNVNLLEGNIIISYIYGLSLLKQINKCNGSVSI